MDIRLWASKDPKPLRSGIPRDSALDVRVKDLSMRVKALQFLANDDWEYYETVADDDWDEYETVATKMNTGVSSSNDMEEKAAEEEKSSEPEPLLLSRVYHHPQALRVACLSDMRYNPLDFTGLLDRRHIQFNPDVAGQGGGAPIEQGHPLGLRFHVPWNTKVGMRDQDFHLSFFQVAPPSRRVDMPGLGNRGQGAQAQGECASNVVDSVVHDFAKIGF